MSVKCRGVECQRSRMTGKLSVGEVECLCKCRTVLSWRQAHSEASSNGDHGSDLSQLIPVTSETCSFMAALPDT